jgi:hypothetical protein
MSGLDRYFRVPFFALVRHVAPNRAHVSDTVIALLPFAAARPSGGVALRLLAHPWFRGTGLFPIRHDKDSTGSVFADHP